MRKTLHGDWAKARPLDLSDEGLVAELAKMDPNVCEDLGIEDSIRRKVEERQKAKTV